MFSRLDEGFQAEASHAPHEGVSKMNGMYDASTSSASSSTGYEGDHFAQIPFARVGRRLLDHFEQADKNADAWGQSFIPPEATVVI